MILAPQINAIPFDYQFDKLIYKSHILLNLTLIQTRKSTFRYLNISLDGVKCFVYWRICRRCLIEYILCASMEFDANSFCSVKTK